MPKTIPRSKASRSKSVSAKKGLAVKTSERKNISQNIALRVLTESGYRCAVPTCRGILALDMHHIWQVSKGGTNDVHNLVALCPTCHNLHHRGTIPAEAIYVYKALSVSLAQAFDIQTIDQLLFLSKAETTELIVSGDGVLRFSRLIASDLAQFSLHANNNGLLVTYALKITPKGRTLIEVWRSGNRGELVNLINTQGDYMASFVKATHRE